jgi:hypothetical protein
MICLCKQDSAGEPLKQAKQALCLCARKFAVLPPREWYHKVLGLEPDEEERLQRRVEMNTAWRTRMHASALIGGRGRSTIEQEVIRRGRSRSRDRRGRDRNRGRDRDRDRDRDRNRDRDRDRPSKRERYRAGDDLDYHGYKHKESRVWHERNRNGRT